MAKNCSRVSQTLEPGASIERSARTIPGRHGSRMRRSSGIIGVGSTWRSRTPLLDKEDPAVDGCHDGGIELALKTLIRQLILSFPESAILSRQVGYRYHVFVIVPYAGGPENTLQVERAWLVESAARLRRVNGCFGCSTCHGCSRPVNGMSCGTPVPQTS
jgi:hypothetical protein